MTGSPPLPFSLFSTTSSKFFNPFVRNVFLKNKSGFVYSSGALARCVSHRSAAKTSIVSLPSRISLCGTAIVWNGFIILQTTSFAAIPFLHALIFFPSLRGNPPIASSLYFRLEEILILLGPPCKTHHYFRNQIPLEVL